MVKNLKEIPKIHWVFHLVASVIILLEIYAAHLVLRLENYTNPIISNIYIIIMANLTFLFWGYLILNLLMIIEIFIDKTKRDTLAIPIVYTLYFILAHIMGVPTKETESIRLMLVSLIFLFFIGFSIYKLRKSKTGWLK
ncbi:hypothetical protein HYT26_01735 [Candidatus Pacearchaeota archaeon]|nr:hypothetical protein [Candidatus Pacearchaeota archaeon]